MEHDPRYAEWSAVLTGLGLASLAIEAPVFPADRPHLERALMKAWPGWSGRRSYPLVIPRDFSIYAMRSTLVEELGYVEWEWRDGIRPTLQVGSASASDVLTQFAEGQPVAPPDWEELARLVAAELSPSGAPAP